MRNVNKKRMTEERCFRVGDHEGGRQKISILQAGRVSTRQRPMRSLEIIAGKECVACVDQKSVLDIPKGSSRYQTTRGTLNWAEQYKKMMR